MNTTTSLAETIVRVNSELLQLRNSLLKAQHELAIQKITARCSEIAKEIEDLEMDLYVKWYIALLSELSELQVSEDAARLKESQEVVARAYAAYSEC
jgi:hypothetical protein